MRKIRRYGWIRQLPDARDCRYSKLVAKLVSELPPMVDLRPKCPPVYDQGQLGSCTANAIAGALEFERMRQNETAFTPSRLFIYYNERYIEGTISSDAGAMIRDGIKSVNEWGDCPETEWPYDIGQFTQRPSDTCYSDALKYRTVQYLSLDQQSDDLRDSLAQGFPFVFGFSVYESFESDAVAETGVVPMPASSEALLGGHAVMAVGYEDSEQQFIVRNSWGTDWGMAGYMYMPYEYLLNPDLASDFWVIKLTL